MDRENIRYYRSAVLELYFRKEYEQALDYALEAQRKFGTQLPDAAYWVACLCSLLNRKTEALKSLKEASEQGFWWSPRMIEHETDFDSIRSDPEFQKIVARFGELAQEAQGRAKPECLCFYPKNFDATAPAKLFMALHARSGTAAEFAERFEKVILAKGYILAAPQSSQIISSTGYCWDDYDLAKAEVKEHYRQLKAKYKIDEQGSIIAGCSQGGKVALGLVLEANEMNIEKALLLIPALAGAGFIPLLSTPKAKKIRGYILVGDQDRLCPPVREFFEETQRLKLSFEMEMVSDMGHMLPENMEPHLHRALRYLDEAG